MPQSRNININTGKIKMSDLMKSSSNDDNDDNDNTIIDNNKKNVKNEDLPEKIIVDTNEIVKQLNNPPPTRENIDYKQSLIFKIQKYQDSSRFGNIVKNELKFNDTYDTLDKMTIENLENILSRIRIHLDNKNLDKFYDNMVQSVALTYETTMSYFYDIDGFSDILLDNDQFWNCWERFKIENNMPSVNSSAQMLFMVAQATLMAHHLPPSDKYDDNDTDIPTPDDVIADIENNIYTTLPTIPENNNDMIITDNDIDKPKVEIKPVSIGGFI
jgi:hypothetical protein